MRGGQFVAHNITQVPDEYVFVLFTIWGQFVAQELLRYQKTTCLSSILNRGAVYGSRYYSGIRTQIEYRVVCSILNSGSVRGPRYYLGIQLGQRDVSKWGR